MPECAPSHVNEMCNVVKKRECQAPDVAPMCLMYVFVCMCVNKCQHVSNVMCVTVCVCVCVCVCVWCVCVCDSIFVCLQIKL